MAKQSNRPTATNYQDYLLDYSGVDLSRYRGQVEGSPEAAAARAYNERHPDRPIRPEEIGRGGVLNDMGHAVAAGLNELAALPFWGAQQVADRMQWDGVARLAGDAKAYFQESAEAKRKGYSADMKLAQEKEFITYDKEKGYGLGTAWSDPRAVLGSVAESLPGMAAGMGAGAVVAKGLMGLGLSRGLAWGIGSAAGEGGVSGGQNSMGAYDAVMAMPEESLRRSPEYVELLRSLRDPAEARKALAHDVALRAGGQTAAATGALAAGPGAMFGRMLGGETGKTLARSVLKMGTAEAAEEALQSGAEEYLSQRQIQRADPTIEPMAGVPNAMVEGALAGGLMGGGMGIPGHYRGRAQAAELPPAPEAGGQTAGPATAEDDGAMPDGAPVAEAAADGAPDRIVPDAGRMERGEHVDLLREDGGPLPATDRAAAAGPAAREESAGEVSPPVEGADSLPVRAGVPDLPSVPGGLTEAVPVPEAGGMPQEPGRALPLSAQMRTTDAAQGVPPADRAGQAGAGQAGTGQAVVPERPAPLVPPSDMRPGELAAGMRPSMPEEAAMPAMPEVVPDILPQPEAQAGPEVGPEVEPGTAVPPQAEAELSASASVAPSAPSAVAQPGPDVPQLGRGELLRLLPEEQRAAARRMTTPRIRELVRQAAAEKAAAVTPEASPLAPRAAESAVPQGQGQPDDPFGQRSAERPETAFDSEQPIPLPHVDGETSPKAGREAHLARTAGAMNGLRTTAVHAHADERHLPSSDSGVSGKNVSAPTAEVNAAEAGAALSAAQPGPVGRHMADRSGEAREGHDGLTRTVAHVPAGVIRKDEHRSAIAAAKDWLREHVSGPVQTRIGIVEVDANAVQDSLSHSIYQNKLDAVQAIVPVLEQGEYLGTLPDKDGKPIENHYFAGKVRIGERESIVFVRTRKAEGMPNRFYVHEVFTQEEIEKSEGIRGVTSDADRPFRNSSDFYRRILAEYLKVKLAGGKDMTAARKTSPADAGHGPVPEARPDGERHLLSPHAESAGKGVAVPAHEASATGEKAPSGQRPGRTSGEGVPQDGDDNAYAARGGEAQNAVDPHEGRRGREEGLSEIEIAPVLYRGVVPKNGVPTQTTGAIDADSLGVLKDTVKPSQLEEDREETRPLASLGTPERRPDSTPVKVVEVEPGSVPEFKKARELAAWLKAYFAGRREETILSTGKRVRFGNGNLEASLKRGRESAHNQAYAALHDLVRLAEYDSFEGSDARHPHLGGQEVYYSALRIGDKLYSVRFKMDVPSEQELTIRKTWQGESDPEDLRYKDHALREIEIAPILYRGMVPKNGVPTQATGAITSISLGVLRDAVKPTRLEEGVLSSVQAAGRHLPPPREVFRSPGAEAIRKAVEALNQRAVHAADVRVVEDMRDLPAGLREAFAAQTGRVEGMYDPATDTVWLVAGNLESVERAVEVWAHENLVHHGLRAVFTPQQRRVLLNQLWQATGGMGNDMVRAIARRYGKDPRGNEADRLLVMEEVLARLAERRAQGLLTEQETGWWRKVVQAVLRAWKKLVQSVSGREGRMDAARMERLLDALQGHVMDGRSARTAEMLEEDGPLASLPAAEREKAHAAWEQVRKDTEAWERQVEEIAAGRGDRFKALRVGATPDVLVRLGARQLPMQMEQRNLKKILSKHNIPLETLRDLPAQLASPLMVFKSATMADAYVVLTEMERDGENLVAAVHFDVTAGRIHVNDVASIHDRSVDRDGKKIPGWVWIRNQIEKGNLRYYDTTRSPRWFRERAGLQLSSVVNHGGYRGIRILTDKDVVKPVQPPLPSLADKEKSLAWARTHRLQLPKVRRLPARLSGNKILDETDVVKPIAPEADGPLASLSEEVASGVRVLRGIMGRGVSEDVADILANKEMGRLVPSQDMGLLERLFKLPHWVAKEHAGFAAVYERQLKRVEERSAALKQALETLPLLFDPDAGKRLRGKELEELAALIWKWDGKPIPALKDVDKFLVREKLPNGRALLRTNPAYRERFREWLRDEPGAERVKQGFLQVRDALDEAFVRAYNRMAGMADLAETDLELYRTEFGSLHNYFPHQRRGRYYVAAFRDGETVFRKHFDVPPGSSVREEWARIVAAHRKEHPGAHWAPPREAEKLPDDILGAPIDPQAMEQIIMAAARRLGGDAKQAAQVRETLLAGVANILKTRGFGAHGIRRQHIPGFETEDIKGVLHAYLAGLNGWLTKMDAAADFAQALGRIDAVKTPRLWEYASQYSKDMLRNSDRIDRITGNIKTVAFAWYLGGNIKTAVVNLTQNLIVGIPRLERYVTGGGGYWLKSAADTIGLRYSGKGLRGARGLSPEEADMLQELYGNNVITDAYMDEIRGQIATSPSLRLWERFVRLLGKPMSMVEVFNRASLALAAYRAARRGAFKAGAAAELGLAPGRKMTHEQARDFAAMLVRDTHFEYGRGNQPEFLRSNTAGRLLSPLFTFRSFGANILNLWWLALRHEGREGRAFVARSLAATVALGGLTTFPFYATLSALCTAASGDDEDWTTKIRQALPEDDLLRDVVCYGLPAVAGVNIGGSLRMETPFTEGMRRGGTFKEAMTESLGALLGIPYDLAVNKPSKALEAHRFGEDAKAVEALVPTFMANLMQAWRLATEGQTTLRGRPLNRPGQPGARRLTPAEAVGKALGFQPTSSAKSFEAYAADKLRTQVRSDRIDIFVNQALDDLDSKGRPYMMRELRKRLTAWNAEMEAEGRADRKIQPKDVLRRVASRRR